MHQESCDRHDMVSSCCRIHALSRQKLYMEEMRSHPRLFRILAHESAFIHISRVLYELQDDYKSYCKCPKFDKTATRRWRAVPGCSVDGEQKYAIGETRVRTIWGSEGEKWDGERGDWVSQALMFSQDPKNYFWSGWQAQPYSYLVAGSTSEIRLSRSTVAQATCKEAFLDTPVTSSPRGVSVDFDDRSDPCAREQVPPYPRLCLDENSRASPEARATWGGKVPASRTSHTPTGRVQGLLTKTRRFPLPIPLTYPKNFVYEDIREDRGQGQVALICHKARNANQPRGCRNIVVVRFGSRWGARHVQNRGALIWCLRQGWHRARALHQEGIRDISR